MAGIKDFFTEQPQSNEQSALQKYSDALWVPKGGQEIVTDVSPVNLSELGIPEHVSLGQQLAAAVKEHANLLGLISDARQNKDGLQHLIDKYSGKVQGQEQTVKLSKDAWNKMGAEDETFTFGVKTINSEQDIINLQKKLDVARGYFDHVDVQRVKDEKTGKEVAIVVVYDQGKFVTANEVNAVLTAENHSQKLGDAVKSLTRQVTAEKQVTQEKTGLPPIDFDKLREKYPPNPSAAGQQQVENIAPKPVYIAQQEPDKSRGGGRAA